MNDEVDFARADLAELDAAIGETLKTGDEKGLSVLGYGEISCVVKWSSGGRSYACKRLPPFEDMARFEAYRVCFDDYLGALSTRGVQVLPSVLATIGRSDGTFGAYCIQPVLPEGTLLPRWLARVEEREARARLREVIERVLSVVGARVGLDGQLSNWAFVDGELRYLDVTTPMLRDEHGQERLDTELFLASLPWVLRGTVRRFLLRDILETYYRPRRVIVDLLANLHKERLAQQLPALLDEANRSTASRRGEIDEITELEVRRYYQSDARTWALLQRVRRLDRWFQRRVRGRVYPFLLPGKIAR